MKTPNRPISFRNRWGALLEIGQPVTIAHPRGGYTDAIIAGFETTGEYANAYGPRVILTNGGSASVDDCRIGLASKKPAP